MKKSVMEDIVMNNRFGVSVPDAGRLRIHLLTAAGIHSARLPRQEDFFPAHLMLYDVRVYFTGVERGAGTYYQPFGVMAVDYDGIISFTISDQKIWTRTLPV